MKKIVILFLLLFFSKISFAYCQPAMSTYHFIARANGTMNSYLSCKDNKITMISSSNVKVLFYQVTFTETAIGRKDRLFGVISEQYSVDDSRENQIVTTQLNHGEVDGVSASYVLGYHLSKGMPIPKTMMIFYNGKRMLYEYHLLSENEKMNTTLGVFDTVKIEGVNQEGGQSIFWFSKKDYSLVREDDRENGESTFDATIIKQSTDIGCCWN